MRIAVVNQKGGTGKTTIAFHLGWGLSKEEDVLLIDTDPQGNLTSCFIDPKELNYKHHLGKGEGGGGIGKTRFRIRPLI